MVSVNHKDVRVCHAFPRNFAPYSQLNPRIQQSCSSFAPLYPGIRECQRCYLFEFGRICHSIRLLVFSLHMTVRTVLYNAPRVFASKAYRFNRFFFLRGVMGQVSEFRW